MRQYYTIFNERNHLYIRGGLVLQSSQTKTKENVNPRKIASEKVLMEFIPKYCVIEHIQNPPNSYNRKPPKSCIENGGSFLYIVYK